MANVFKEAKKIQRVHKSWDWQKCIQAASKRHKPARKKVGAAKKKKPANRQTGSSVKQYDKLYKAKRPGKRKSASGSVYTERRMNRTDKPGTLTGVSTASLKSALKSRLLESLGKNLLAKDQAPKKSVRNKIQKKVTVIRRQLNKLK